MYVCKLIKFQNLVNYFLSQTHHQSLSWKTTIVCITHSSCFYCVDKMSHSFIFFRGVPTHRGWVKKIRFAPGKGNQKLLVMYTDGAEVWDTKEVCVCCLFI